MADTVDDSSLRGLGNAIADLADRFRNLSLSANERIQIEQKQQEEELEYLRRKKELHDKDNEFEQKRQKLNDELEKQRYKDSWKSTKGFIKNVEEISKAVNTALKSIGEFRQKQGEIEKLAIEREKIRQVYEKDIMLERLKAENEINLRRAQYLKEQSIAFTRAAVGSITSGINEGAYKAYETQLEYQKATHIMEIENMKTNLNLQQKLQQKAVQNYVDLQKNANKTEIAEREKNIAVVNGITNSVSGVVSLFPGYGKAIGTAVNMIGGLVSGGMELEKAFEQVSNMLQEAGFEKDTAVLEKLFEMYGSQISQVTDLQKVLVEYNYEQAKAVLELTRSTEKWIDETEKGATMYSRMFGYLGTQFDNFRSGNVRAGGISDWAAQVGLKMSDIANMVSGYQSTTGRRGLLSQQDVTSIALLDQYMGESGYALKLAATLQDFNVGVADASAMAMKHMNSVARQGLSMSKYAKDIEKYMSLANKYQFKDGTEGIMRMAEYMQRTKGSMDELSGILDKFRTGDISNILESTARLNVLGGNAALFSDPLGMLYDAYMDPEGMYKRVQAMSREFGMFSSRTGQLEFGMADQMKMQMISQATGIDYSSMVNQLRDADRRRRVEDLLKGKGFTEDMVSNLAANAFYKEGKWYAMTAQGKTKEVSDFSDTEAKSLIPKETGDDIMRITSNTELMKDSLMSLKSIEERRVLAEGIGQYKFISRFYDEYKKQSGDRVDVYSKNIDKGLERFSEAIINQMQDMTGTYGLVFDDEAALRSAFGKFMESEDGMNGAVKKLGEIQSDVNAIAKKYGAINNTELETSILQHYGKNMDISDLPKHMTYTSGNIGRKNNEEEYAGKKRKVIRESRTEQIKNFSSLNAFGNLAGSSTSIFPDAINYGEIYVPDKNAMSLPSDANLSWRKGDQVDTLFNGVAKNVNSIGAYVARTSGGGFSGGAGRDMNVNVNFGGNARIDCNGSASGNVVEMIASDPFAIRKISEMVLTEISRYNDGRGTVNAYTNVGNIFS